MPRLRFPEFKEEWEEKTGNEIFKSISDKNHTSELPILAISQEYGAIPRDLIDYKITVTDKSVSSYKVVRKGNFIISLRSFQGGIEYSEYDGICSPAYVILKSKIAISDYFFKYYLKTDRYILELNKKLEGIRDGKMISYGYFSEIKLPYPSLLEQKRIADLLSLIDKRIQCQRKIIEGLQSYKSAVSKKIFSQELRFKNQDEKDFPDWEMYKLGQLLIEANEKTTRTNQYRILSSTAKGLFNQDEYFTRDIASKDNTGYKILKKGQLVFSPQNLWLGNINVNMNFEIGIVSPSYKIFSFNETYTIPTFCQYILLTPKMMYEYEQSSVQGASVVRRNLDMEKFYQIEVLMPALEEQIKIANFLSCIDQKVNLEIALLEQLKSQKQYLLQQLFI